MDSSEKVVRYPFTAIVGQKLLKKALLLNCIMPSIGGVLISGSRGTAKSTMVRALDQLLPHKNVVDLPLNATEDMLLGCINLNHAIQQGKTTFDPGLLARTNGHILYVDEVNLLPAQIANLVLEVAGSGICQLAREGIIKTYPSRFVLLGSMNPEEGQLSAQMLDRFGLGIDIRPEMNMYDRQQIMKRRLQFEANPIAFVQEYAEKERALYAQIETATERIHQVTLPEKQLRKIADICHQKQAAGHRAEIAIARSAIANTAWEGRTTVTDADIELVAPLALWHRTQHTNEDDSTVLPEHQDRSADRKEDQQRPEQPQDTSTEHQQGNHDDPEGAGHEPEKQFQIGAFELNRTLNKKGPIDKTNRQSGSGKSATTRTKSKQGHFIQTKVSPDTVPDIALAATLRAAAPFQRYRKSTCAISIHPEDLRYKIRHKRTGKLTLFLLDTSGSMGINKRMSEAKAAIFELLKEAYINRDSVGLITFNQKEAKLVLPPTRSLTRAHQLLKQVGTGGKTPLADGLEKATKLIRMQLLKNKDIIPAIVIMSDGRANYSASGHPHPQQEVLELAHQASQTGIRFIIIDTESGFVRLGMAQKLADVLQAEYYDLEDLKQIIKTI